MAGGSPLSASDVRLVAIESDFAALDSLVAEAAIPAYEGWILEHPIAEGELIGVSSLAEPAAGDGLRSMSIPVPVEHAAGGGLSLGDRIDVVSVVDGSALYVATDLEVLGAATPDGGKFGSFGEYHLVVAVDSDQALALAEAIDSGSLEVIRSTGAIPLSGLVDHGS